MLWKSWICKAFKVGISCWKPVEKTGKKYWQFYINFLSTGCQQGFPQANIPFLPAGKNGKMPPKISGFWPLFVPFFLLFSYKKKFFWNSFSFFNFGGLTKLPFKNKIFGFLKKSFSTFFTSLFPLRRIFAGYFFIFACGQERNVSCGKPCWQPVEKKLI